MNKKSLLTNFKIMFLMYILLILFICVFLFSFPIRTNAATAVSQFGTYLDTVTIDELTSTSEYTYDAYNSDTIKDNIFQWSNEKLFENKYTEEEFFKHYSYVVHSYNATTIRVFVQNYDRVMDYQGLSPIEGQDIKFFFANMTLQYQEGLYRQYNGGVSAIYSYYIDINYNSMSYTFSNNNPLLDLNFYSLNSSSSWFANVNDRTYLRLNMKLFDSFNGNFAWIQTWAETYNTTSLWNQVAGTTPPKTSLYYNSPIDFPKLEYVSSGVTPGDGGGGSTGGTDLSGIEDKIDETNGILSGIGGTITKIEESIGTGLNQFIQGILDTLKDIYNWLTDLWSTDPLENLTNKFVIEDFGEENFIMLLVGYFEDLRTDVTVCEPIVIDVPYLSTDDKITLPCMTQVYKDISSEFLSFYQLVTTGIISFAVIVNVYDTIAILLDPTTDLWISSRKHNNSDIVRVNAKTGEVID